MTDSLAILRDYTFTGKTRTQQTEEGKKITLWEIRPTVLQRKLHHIMRHPEDSRAKADFERFAPHIAERFADLPDYLPATWWARRKDMENKKHRKSRR